MRSIRLAFASWFLRLAELDGWKRSITLASVGLFARLVHLFGFTDPNLVRSDAGHYHEIATYFSRGEGFASTFPQLEIHATAFRPPVYPVALGSLYRVIGPSVVAGKVLNILIGLGVILLTDRLVRSMSSRVAGFVAAGLVAIYPQLIANDTNLLTEPLSLLILLLLIERVVRERWASAGLLSGLLLLTRPSAPMLVVVLGVWIARRAGLKRSAVFLACVALVIAPWIVRNRVQVHTWSLYTSNGFNLAAMYSLPAQQARSFVDPVANPAFDDYRFSQFDEAAWEAEMTQLGLEGIRAHPTYVLGLVARNAVATFELRPSYNEGAEREDGRNELVRRLSLPIFYAVTAIGCVGLYRSRSSSVAVVTALSAASFIVPSLFFLAPPRLRAPFDLACCIGVGLFVAQATRLRTDSGAPPERQTGGLTS